MRIIVIGATGTIGSAVSGVLAQKHDIVRVGNRSGDFQVDLAVPDSIRRLYDQVGKFDALVCAAGVATLGKLSALCEEDLLYSLMNKALGQILAYRIGRDRIRPGGSFTLTSGVLSRDPQPGTSAVAAANGAIDAFVKAAALEIENGVRLNAVSPGFVSETLQKMGLDPSPGIPAAKVAGVYAKAVEGDASGAVLDVRDFL